MNKYQLYEESVQSPEHDVIWLSEVFRRHFNRNAKILREDFCGTFKLCKEWIELNQNNQAIAIDLDPQPLNYGKKTHLKKLSSAQKKKLKIICNDVTKVSQPRAEIICAYNFSFNVFKLRAEFLAYLKNAYRALKPNSMMVMEVAGGPGIVEKTQEKTSYKKNKKKWFTYIWDQKKFDPITAHGEYAIHFEMNQRKYQNVFNYSWRVWTVPEIIDLLHEAGFNQTKVYWEKEYPKKDSEYVVVKNAPNEWSYVCYIIGLKTKV